MGRHRHRLRGQPGAQIGHIFQRQPLGHLGHAVRRTGRTPPCTPGAQLAVQIVARQPQQAWHEGLYQTIISVQQAEGCGLVVKQHVPDNPLKKALLTPEDWKLLRYCPGPVLMVKTERPWTGGVILAAVDVGNHDEDHRTLHGDIID